METARAIARLRIIWMALMTAVVVYGVVGFVVSRRAGAEVPAELRGWIEIFLAILAGIHLLVALFLKQMVAGVSGGRYLTYCILRWALVEAIGLFGLVLAILQSTPTVYGAFLVASLGCLLLMPPREAETQAVRELGR